LQQALLLLPSVLMLLAMALLVRVATRRVKQ
jgi:hypothetical protein